MKNVIIFGAGASKKAGAPLMATFLDKADNLRRKRDTRINNSISDYDNVFEAISELQGVYAKSHLDLDNIETLFSAIEMGILLEKFASRKPQDITKLKKSLITVIYKTIENSMIFPVKDSHVFPVEPYGSFFEKIIKSRDKTIELFSDLSFITFNYDLGLDYAIDFKGFKINYGINDIEDNDSFELLKLHGSINWGICPNCEKILPLMFGSPHKFFLEETGGFLLENGSMIHTLEHCDTKFNGPPLIVPPTWNKTQYNGQLVSVWRKAAKRLCQAENIFIIGYSLPETDSFFQYLFALGTESSTRIKRFWVYDPDTDEIVENRYKKLIGRGIENRFKFFRKKFEDVTGHIAEAVSEV